MMKRMLSFYTNIPTPYQDDFFTALATCFELTVIYYARSERGRQWVADDGPKSYRVMHLRDSRFAGLVQHWIKDYHFSWSIFRTIRHDSADYLIVSGGYWVPNTVCAMLLARLHRRKVAFFGERLSGRSTGWKTYLKQVLLWPLRHACVRVFAVGHEAARTYVASGINLPVTVVPYCIDIRKFSGDCTRSSRADRLFVFLSAGSLIHRKGMDTLVRAMRTLDPVAYSHVRLRLLGDGPERKSLQQLAGDDTRIEWLGFREATDLPGCFANADAFVFASRCDGWGVVINEAIAAGLPVVSSDAVGAARAWIQDGVNGFLCAPDAAGAFGIAMRRLVDDPALRHQQAKFNRNFREQTSAAQYAEVVYRAILNDLRE